MSAESVMAEKLEELIEAIDADLEHELELQVYPRSIHSPRYYRAIVDARKFVREYRNFNPKGKR